MDTETSVAVKALISFAALSTITAFVLNIMNERRQRSLLDWVRAARPAAWHALPRTISLLPDAAAVAHLRRTLDGDIDFEIREAAARRGRPAMLATLFGGVVAIGVTLGGVLLGVWSI